MRSWILSLSLLAACADTAEPFAPEADAASLDRTVKDRLDRLERLTTRLRVELESANATIVDLQSQLTVQGGNLELHDNAIIGLQSDMEVQGGNLELHDAAIVRLDDYANALAGPDVAQDGFEQDGLFMVNKGTGVRTPRIDGSGTATLRRIRQRPEILFQEWNDTVISFLTELQQNPLCVSNEPEVNPLFQHGQRLNTLETELKDLKALAEFLKSDYGKRIGTLETTVVAVDAALDKLEGRTDVLDGTVLSLDGKLKEVKELADILKNEYGIRVAALEKDAGTTAATLLELRKADDGLGVQAAALDAKLREVKELADILKADYGIRLDGLDGAVSAAQGDVDDLWVEVADLSGATCAASDLAAALFTSDDVLAAEAYERIDAGVCGTL